MKKSKLTVKAKTAPPMPAGPFKLRVGEAPKLPDVEVTEPAPNALCPMDGSDNDTRTPDERRAAVEKARGEESV